MLGQTQFVGSEFGNFEGSGGFVVQFWLANLGSEGFEVGPLGFEAVRSWKFSLKCLL